MTFHGQKILSGCMHGSLARQLNHFVADDVTGKVAENRNVNAGELLLTPMSSRCSIWHYRRANGRKQGPDAIYRNHKAREFTCWMSVTSRWQGYL